jgi:hypothetical protein
MNDTEVPMPTEDAPAHTSRPPTPVPTFLGVAVTVRGFVAMAIAWAGVAGEDNVADQIPAVVSGVGFGLALVIVGVTIISVAAKRRDSMLREQQVQLLAQAITHLVADEGGR